MALFLATSSEASKLVASLHGKLRAYLTSPQEELEGHVKKMVTTSLTNMSAHDGPKQKGKQSRLKYYMYYRF